MTLPIVQVEASNHLEFVFVVVGSEQGNAHTFYPCCKVKGEGHSKKRIFLVITNKKLILS